MVDIITKYFFLRHSTILQGSTRGQQFKCADVVNSSNTEIVVKTFTQSQCYGEYHCFHAKLTNDNFVEIHVGAPTPNVEHACLKPSFDLEVPYLLATLIPTDFGIYFEKFHFIKETYFSTNKA